MMTTAQNWGNVTPTKKSKPPRILIYGRNGVGKSSFANEAPSPVFLDLEHNIGEIACVSNDDLGVPTQDFLDALTFVKKLTSQEHSFKTLVVDSLDALEVMIHKRVCLEENVKTILEIPYGRGHAMAFVLWQQFLETVKKLWSSKDMNIIFIAHDTITRYDNPTTVSYDRHQLKIHEKPAGLLMDWCNCVFFASKDIHFIKETNNGQTTSKGREGARSIYTEGDCAYLAKNTYKLPAKMSLDANVFWKHINEFQTSERK